MQNTKYIDFIIDMLAPLQHVRCRKMFSGYGIYKDSVFFALVLNDTLYFKVGTSEISLYESYDSKPFSYTKKTGQQVVMSYWEVPADIIENHDNLVLWAERAWNTALQAHQAKKTTLSTRR